MQKAAVGKERVHWASAKLNTCIGWKQTELPIPTRCFAAPVRATLAKPMRLKETKGRRLNDKITTSLCAVEPKAPHRAALFSGTKGGTQEPREKFDAYAFDFAATSKPETE